MVDLAPYERLVAIDVIRDLVQRWWGVDLALADAEGRLLGGANGGGAPNLRRFADAVRCACERLRPARHRGPLVEECAGAGSVVVCPVELDGAFAGCVFAGAVARPGDGAGGAPPLDRLVDLLEMASRQIRSVHAGTAKQDHAIARLQREIGRRYRFEDIIGRSRAMQEVFRLLEKICESESTVLIEGESGTGKELVARAIHYNGPRARRPFVAQNCSAFVDSLLESALFGHVRGAFTGAVRDKKGLFEVADGGTFFLDEIGDMSPALQTKVLRVLEEGAFTPVGSTETRRVDVRVIAATHKDLGATVERGEFREDLYYRIHVIRVALPPLRERIEDLPLLVDHFLRKHRRNGSSPPRLGPAAMQALGAYHWPGNIRELENEIERMLVLAGEDAAPGPELLSPRIARASNGRASGGRRAPRGTMREAVETIEREMIRDGLARTGGNRSQLAKELGVSRSNLIVKIERYRLDGHR